MKTVAWIIVLVVVVIPISTQCARSVSIERIVVKPSQHSDLCIRTSGSIVKLQPCSDGAQVFEKITVTRRGGIQIRTVLSKRSSASPHCIFTSSTSITDDGFSTSTSSVKVQNGNCNKRNKFQIWDVKSVGIGFQVENRGSKQCVSADPVDGAVLVTTTCLQGEDNQSWSFVKVKESLIGGGSSDDSLLADGDSLLK